MVPALPRPKMASLTVEGAAPELQDRFSSYCRYLKSQSLYFYFILYFKFYLKSDS